MYRAALSKDFRKMMRYTLSAHVLQVFLITPFYLMFHLQEVWYVNGHPDGLARNLGPQAAAGVTLNCFPSMHTSIAFAMFLVVLHEKIKYLNTYGHFLFICSLLHNVSRNSLDYRCIWRDGISFCNCKTSRLYIS
ncbi:hypothetical protein JTS97_14810 [Clostridium botulinum]|nr:hypothetical protein [Clostridium botulinum]